MMELQVDVVWRWAGLATAAKERKARALGLDPAAAFPPYTDDLKYSMRSVLWNCRGWLRNVFLVLDDDEMIPLWLDTTCPVLKIVRHSEFIPKRFLPTYNQRVIDSYLHRLTGLADHFLVVDDDMFVCRRIPSPLGVFFDASDHLPIVRIYEGPDRHSLRPSKIPFVTMWQNAHRKYGIRYTRIQHHVQPFYKPLLARYYREIFARDVEATAASFRVRTRGEPNMLRLSQGLAVTLGDVHFVRRGDDSDLFIEAPDVTHATIKAVAKRRPMFLCVNNNYPHYVMASVFIRSMFGAYRRMCGLEQKG